MTSQPNSNPGSEPEVTKEEIITNNGKANTADSSQSLLAVNNEELSKVASTTPSKSLSKTASVKLYGKKFNPSQSLLIIMALSVMSIGLWLNLSWIVVAGAIATLLFSLSVVIKSIRIWLLRFFTPQERKNIVAFIGFSLAIAVLAKYLGVYKTTSNWLAQFEYDEFGSWAEWVGALGQISIAVLAVYIAWEQYVISKDLTIQQNRITQQQTIDAYFQGVSDLALDEQGLLEDWPQERAIAEGRTAAIFASVDAEGKAKILRFLSQSKLLTPLKRDNLLGRPIFDGEGGYAEDRSCGIRVIHLGVMLAGADLSGQDLRWTELSEANMVRANLSRCDLVKANFSLTILSEVNLSGADIKGARFFYSAMETASPRSRTLCPNYETGEYTGAVIEKINLKGVRRISEEQRYYFCAWGGEFTRGTVPGGCEGIPNLLGR
jgi:uncharacterized protein YjbI with pentapeptide repeats